MRQIARFVVVGTSFTLLYFGLYAVLRIGLAAVPANLIASLVTTVIGSEAHRRVTFDGRPSRRLRMVVQNLATWSWYGGTTSLGLFSLELFVASPSYAQETAAILSITAVGGIARFAALRWWVLAPKASRRRQRSAAAS